MIESQKQYCKQQMRNNKNGVIKEEVFGADDEAMILPYIEKFIAEIYKEALHRKSESELLARHYY